MKGACMCNSKPLLIVLGAMLEIEPCVTNLINVGPDKMTTPPR